MAQKSTVVGVPRELTSQNRMGMAGVTPASSIPRIQFSTGAAKALSDFSFDMFQMSSRVEDELDQQASAEAQVEGAADGATGSFEVRDYTTIRNRAYNQAGIQTFISTLETRSIFGTAEIQRQYANDPNGMAAAMQQYHQGIAGELNGVSPGAGAAYLQRSAMRTVPAVEAARDAQFALTRDQANAALIESQVALDAELTTHSANLFSDNPARSQAAASALQVVGQELMRVYDAVDPTTGRPLYSAEEKARARAGFNERVFETATLSWFEGQEDKAAAYTQFVEGDFTFELNVSSEGSGGTAQGVVEAGAGYTTIRMADGSVVRRDGTRAWRNNNPGNIEFGNFARSQGAVGSDGRFAIFPTYEAGREAKAALIFDSSSYRNLSISSAISRYAPAFENDTGSYTAQVAAAAGVSSDAIMSSLSANQREAVLDAMERVEGFTVGRSSPSQTVTETQSVDMRRAMTPAAMARLESEMRSQITFQNTQADRAAREEDREHIERQEIGFTLITHSYLNGGREGVEPLSEDMIQGMLERQEISYAQARQGLQWLATSAPEVSNTAVFEELQRRMYQGDDIEGDIQSSLSQLSRSDASALLAKNQSLNSETASTMTEEQRGYLTMIRQTVAPDGMLAQLDQGASMRAFNAQDEYRKRISEGEDAATVSRDIVDRAQRETVAFEAVQLQRMLRPRFAVSSGNEGRIDVRQTAVALDAAKTAGTISEASYQRQRALVMEWARLQGDVN